MIFYFSGTGNTRWAATHIAKATNDTLSTLQPNAKSMVVAIKSTNIHLIRMNQSDSYFPYMDGDRHSW